MARRALEWVVFTAIGMLGAYGVIRTEREPLGRAIQQLADPLRHAAQAAEGALTSGGRSIDQEPEAVGLGGAAGVDALL